MKISVVLVFHSELDFLPLWFENAKRFADQIVVAAHAPTDGSLEYVRGLQGSYPAPVEILEFPEDTVFRHGFSHMKNACIERCTGDWIVFLDADEEMDMDKSQLAPFVQGRNVAVSTMTMHMTERRPHWSLSDTATIKAEADWINQRHWRIVRNGLGVRWRGLIHEELRLPNGQHVATMCRTSPIKMWHYGSMADQSKRGFKDGLYAELLFRISEQPELREGTNAWWIRTYLPENRAKLAADREKYLAERSLQGSGSSPSASSETPTGTGPRSPSS